MSSAGGLQRRRVANSSSQNDDDDGEAWGLNGSATTSKQHTPTGSVSGSLNASASHAGSAFEGGSKIAFDPRDLVNQDEEDARQGGKAPRLTIMEEVLLLGLKDKQASLHLHLATVSCPRCSCRACIACCHYGHCARQGLKLERVTHP